MKKINKDIIQEKLFENSDLKYKELTEKIVPTLEKDRIIGVRIPILRKIAKEFTKTHPKDIENFLKKEKYFYLEESNLHAALLEEIKDIKDLFEKIDTFLPKIDNWVTCDILNPKIFKKYPNEVFKKLNFWIKSDYIYAVRFAINILIRDFTNDLFEKEHLNLVANIKLDDYYIKMAKAWYFSVVLAKQYDKTINFIESKTLDKWVQNKTIQKAIESLRISEDKKNYLKKLKIK